MRQATWNEVFAPREQAPMVLAPEVPKEPSGWRRLFWWEDVVTFLLAGIMLLAVVAAIEHANWVDGVPSLYPIAFFGLFMGAVLSRLHWPEGFIHLIALPIGAAASLGMILSVLPGRTPWDRYDVLHERMANWFHIAFYGGISNDNLPVIVLIVPLTWLGAYLSAWAVFRWQNAWLAAIPGGVSLLLNISVSGSGAIGQAFLVYIVAGALLVTRMHLLDRAKAWRHDGTPYPATISLSVLHATFWVALLLLAGAWLMPQADETSALESLWDRATKPAVDRAEGYSRLFMSVNHRQGTGVHDFEDILPFLGSIDLPEGATSLQLQTGELDEEAFLRAQAYYLYTEGGWRTGKSDEASLPANTDTYTANELLQREDMTVRVISGGRSGNTIFTVGQPVSVDRDTTIEEGGLRFDITGVESQNRVRRGQTYEATGSVSIATEDNLRAAGDAYPGWVRERYLQLPDDFSQAVQDLARQVAAGSQTPYDAAIAVQSYLRDIPYDLDVPKPPPNRDPVEYFLFEAKRGYFDYHASAMVMMLRSQGVPARLAVGYVISPDERDPTTGRIRVTEANAYAWPEVYFPKYGWLEFNPTPDHPPIVRGDATLDPEEDTARDESVSQDLFGLVNQDPGAITDGQTSPVVGESSSNAGPPWLIIGLATGLALLLVTAAGGLRFAWVRGLSSLDTPSRLWGQTVRLASWTRVPAGTGETPREFSARLHDEGVNGAGTLSDAYVRHRFGREGIDSGEEQRLEAAWRSVRTKLLRRLIPFVRR